MTQKFYFRKQCVGFKSNAGAKSTLRAIYSLFTTFRGVVQFNLTPFTFTSLDLLNIKRNGAQLRANGTRVDCEKLDLCLSGVSLCQLND